MSTLLSVATLAAALRLAVPVAMAALGALLHERGGKLCFGIARKDFLNLARGDLLRRAVGADID